MLKGTKVGFGKFLLHRHCEEIAIKILTYNVHSCVGSDGQPSPGRIAEVIAACDPDVVALQELDVGRKRTGSVDQAHAIATQLSMRLFFHPAIQVAEEQYGDAILTSLDMRLIKAGPLPSFGERRGALWVEANYRGNIVNIINTHLGLSRRDRSAQVAALLGPGWLGHADCRSPKILLGDFNAGRSSLAYRQISNQFADVWAGGTGRPRKTFPSRLPLVRIDHIFVERSMQVTDVGVVSGRTARMASDHLPLYATIAMSKT
ncbi:endonuclease/exonuclease/phosphatase family protein [Phyllobacterium zundukense]|uniref:Endonuclease/exonuclease/phosphatase family protein n=1 Tax=Phyllobacterium zundukense TaxID=1867719 RepID=A0ACD4CZK6_9HYPH|nr:endonuclease/exonuclease/phosphatase family protein [Phyllobacterium zundukense]UXN58996.1 endonuclease/exonuclease/phosphatase family protein [Phyllobacterium zundukense]